MSISHDTYESQEKLAAREENVAVYRKLTGLHAIPAHKQYVTLCARQTDSPNSEINQMLRLGLIHSKKQFVGIDMVEELIVFNRATHPDAHWVLQCDGWQEALLSFDFNPALIYLDTEHIADRKAQNLVAQTMALCPVETVILLNVAQSNPWYPTQEQGEFLAGLAKRVPNLKNWEPEQGVVTFDYVSYRTVMRTMAFYLKDNNYEDRQMETANCDSRNPAGV